MGLEFTLEKIDEVLPRGFFVADEIDPEKTAILAMDIQKLCVDPKGAAYIESVAGAPSGQDVLGPINTVLDRARAEGMHIVWSRWGLRGDGADAGMCTAKWPPMEPGTPDSPASWGNRDAEIADETVPLEDEIVIDKHRFSSFYNTPLDEYMRDWGCDTLVIVGVTSANCGHATCIDGWNKNYKMVILADCSTALPHPGEDQPMGTGQHWEALRNIQMNYGDVLLSSEFFAKLDEAKAKAGAAA
ncbi:MAG: cysteine hydrolase family protein [Gaiellaceae bacterium]